MAGGRKEFPPPSPSRRAEGSAVKRGSGAARYSLYDDTDPQRLVLGVVQSIGWGKLGNEKRIYSYSSGNWVGLSNSVGA